MPSEKTLHRARMSAAIHQAREETKSYRVLELTPAYVLFTYGGHQIRFEWRQGDLVRMGGENIYLQPSDYAFLYTQANMLTTANIKGLNSAKVANKKERVVELPQPQLPFLFTGQTPTQGSHS